MSKERLEILKMVRDGVITAEQAEGLLKALDESTGESEAPHPDPARQTKAVHPLDALRQVIESVKPVVKNAIDGAMAGITGLASEFIDEADDPITAGEPGQPLDPASGPVRLEPGTLVVIRSNRTWGVEGADLTVTGVEGETLSLVRPIPGQISMSRSEALLDIRWTDGPLALEVPRHIRALHALTMGGKIRLAGLPCELVLRTFSGSLVAVAVESSFKIRTMAGNVALTLAPSWRGTGLINTVGSGIALSLPQGVPGEFSAVTQTGSITVAEAIGQVTRQQAGIRHSVHFTQGGSGTTSTLTARSLGGSIRIDRPPSTS